MDDLGDHCIHFFYLGRSIFDYMVGNFVLRRRVSSPNETFEYGFLHSNALVIICSPKAQYFAPNVSFVSNVKPLYQPITSDVTYDIGAPTVNCRIY